MADNTCFVVVDTERKTAKRADRVIVGFDPATKASGWAILGLDGDRETILKAGTFRPVGLDRMGALANLYTWARDLVKLWTPAAVAIETVYHGPNAQTTIRLAEVGAVIRLAVMHAGAGILEVVEVAPAERAKVLGLGGRCTKADIVAAVNLIYGLELSDHNAADAVAIAAQGAAFLRIEGLKELEITGRLSWGTGA